MLKTYKTQVLILAWCALWLAECTQVVNSSVGQAQHALISNPYGEKVASHLVQAKAQKGRQKQQSLLSAAGRLIVEGQWQHGLAILAQTHDLTLTQMDEKNILLAEVDRMRDKPDAALEEWQAEFDSHSENQLLPIPSDSIADQMPDLPRHIALLLPFTGELAGPAEAIRDGFMAAYEANHSDSTIQFYDTNQKDVAAIYRQAIQKGADFVLGPLQKKEVAIIAALQHPVPTVLLNDSDLALGANSYAFAISPSQEAREVAIKARSNGYRHALVIVPKGDWGYSISQAFKEQWRKQGGIITDTYSYADHEDINQRMRDFLHIHQSPAPENRMKKILGHRTVITRRHDFDVVFLLAYPSKARQIIPLLKYYDAGDVPVYATSTAFSGKADALKDKDLDGLLFCDTPWVFSHQMIAKNWPEQWNSYNRLYALGMDSQALTTQLNQLLVFPSDTSQATGSLYLKSNQQVARVFEWGQFKQGLVHSLGKG